MHEDNKGDQISPIPYPRTVRVSAPPLNPLGGLRESLILCMYAEILSNPSFTISAQTSKIHAKPQRRCTLPKIIHRDEWQVVVGECCTSVVRFSDVKITCVKFKQARFATLSFSFAEG